MTKAKKKHIRGNLSCTLFILFLLSFLVIDVTGEALSTCFQDVCEADIDYEHTRPASKITKAPPLLKPLLIFIQSSDADAENVFPILLYSINSNLNFVQSGAKQAEDLTTIPTVS